MNVPTRSSNPERLLRSPFRGRNRESTGRDGSVREYREVSVTRITQRPRLATPGRVESELGQATYNCACGFVFQAPVLTSVDCPHCGDSQAW